MGRAFVNAVVCCALGAAVCPAQSEPSFLNRTATAVFRFSKSLPDFLCEQVTSRFVSSHDPPVWELQDTVTAEVMYLDGKESYRDIQRDGKRADPERTGAWSSGEFGTLMLSLFHPDTRAEFTDRGQVELDGAAARRYDYQVARKTSHWRVTYGIHSTVTAYEGSVWIDPETLRVKRIEMRARRLPLNFGLDRIETTVTYGDVEIGDKDYVLITRAENVACRRGLPLCTRNEIEFRGYRKFTAETTIR